MAYIPKTTEVFQKDLIEYLKENPIESSPEKTLIENFSTSNLSDLYRLFLNLENIKLNEELIEKLSNKLKENFEINPNEIFNDNETAITETSIKILENIIKNKYLENISTQTEFDDTELYNLSVIVNKVFPEVFQNLIKHPVTDIKEQQKYIKNKVLSTIDHYHSHASKEAEEENRDIAAALYDAIKRHYPHLSAYVVFRIKAMKSSVDNINKEFTKSITNLIPSDLEKGVTMEDLQNQFSLEDANTDFSGFTIVLNNTDDVLHFDKTNPKSSEILKIRKTRKQNIIFTHSLENFLTEREDFIEHKDLLQIKIDLLMRLRESTYEQCTKEYKGTSFAKLLQDSINDYHQLISLPPEKQQIDDDYTYFSKLDEIEILLEELKKRVHDKYQTKILEIVIPEILEDELLTNELLIKSKFEKTVIKKNGFYSTYYTLITPTRRKIELQVQPYMRFKESKDGSSDHSKLPNKSIDISRFFEPTDPNCDPEQYKYFLNLLNTTPVTVRNFLIQSSDTLLTFREKNLKRKLKIAEQNVKLRDFLPYISKNADGTEEIRQIPIETELPLFAEYVSPKLSSTSSHHTRFKNIAAYNKKSLVSCFKEVLLKSGDLPCLAQELVTKLEEILPNDKNEVSKDGIKERAAIRNKKHIDTEYIEH